MNEFRVFGPPGTGKTTYLTRQIEHARAKFGRDGVLVGSFTKTAATEIAQRAGLKRGDNAGTLHALCFRALDRPTIAETQTQSWNDWIVSSGYSPALRLSKGSIDEEVGAVTNDAGQTTRGDELLGEVQGLRARLADPHAWPTAPREFYRAWSQWKHDANLLDFTDLIEQGINEVGRPPAGTQVGFFDEVQDMTPLELKLVRTWAKALEFVILAGDDDQCIFSFKGATPSAFLDPDVAPDHKRVLEQSYRVPRAVHKLADRWIRQVAKREPKEYRPRDDDGVVEIERSASWKDPDQVVREVERVVANGQTAMILATCSFMLGPTLACLRSAGLPFHNPYRVKRGDWNPIRTGGKNRSASDRLLAYLRPDPDAWGEDARLWSYKDLEDWIEPMQSAGLLKRGAKTTARRLAQELGTTEIADDDIAAMFASADVLERFLDLDPAQFLRSVIPSRRAPFQFPVAVARKRGPATLLKRPAVTVGTVHSVKGGEADVVFLFPDLSPGGFDEYTDARRRDSVIRVFYVAFTRARSRLVLCSQAGPRAVDWGIE